METFRQVPVPDHTHTHISGHGESALHKINKKAAEMTEVEGFMNSGRVITFITYCESMKVPTYR